MSRPNWSVPNTWRSVGPLRRCARSNWLHGYGSMSGATRPTLTNSAMPATPTRARRLRRRRPSTAFSAIAIESVWLTVVEWSLIANARIQHAVQKIDGEIHEHDQHRHEENGTEDHRVVPCRNGAYHEEAEPRQREDRLGKNRSGEEDPDLEPDDRHERDECVSERVTDVQRERGEPIRMRR